MRDHYLGLGLHGEGPTDLRFLAPVVARLTSSILLERGRYSVTVSPVIDVGTGTTQGRAERLTEAVGELQGTVDVLFVHADGSGDPEGALDHVVRPLIDRLQTEHGDAAPTCVPVVPVREMEAWAIADPAALAHLLRSQLDAEALGLPSDAARCESVADPKAALREAVSRARSRTRRRRGGIPYEPLGERVHLERLDRLPAFQRMRAALIEALGDRRLLTTEAS